MAVAVVMNFEKAMHIVEPMQGHDFKTKKKCDDDEMCLCGYMFNIVEVGMEKNVKKMQFSLN